MGATVFGEKENVMVKLNFLDGPGAPVAERENVGRVGR